MSTHVLDKIIAKLIQSGSIRDEDKELYAYGLQQGLFIILNILTTLLIGQVCGMFWQSLLFMAIYLPLRSFAGGFHAKTPTLCYLYSIILTSAVLLAIRFIPWTNYICLGLAVLSGAGILILSPVEDSNKPLDKLEITVYKNRTRIILIAELLMYLLVLGLGKLYILPVITVSLFALSIMLILGKVKEEITC